MKSFIYLAEGKNQYSINRFIKVEVGKYECPAGKPMEYKKTISNEDGHSVDIYDGADCGNCSFKR